MKLIAHRGNIDGPSSEENRPDYIQEALNRGYEVELDAWHVMGKWYLGHFEPQYEITFNFLRHTGMWIHCKHYKALEKLIDTDTSLNFFYHTNEDYVLTSQNWIWAFPNKIGTKKTICVLPEYYNTSTIGFGGVCSDYVGRYDQ